MKKYFALLYAASLLLVSDLSLATQVAKPEKSATPLPPATCKLLSLSAPKEFTGMPEFLPDLYKALQDFEDSFAKDDKELFKTLLHPAMRRTPLQKDEAFISTVQTYGLAKVKLVRSAIFLGTFAPDQEPVADCPSGTLRGVIGPAPQVAVVHTYFGGGEQVRLFSIYAPILKVQADAAKSKYKTGLVMFHAQVWTHEKKAPDKLIEDARKWGILNEPVTAWLLAESGRRILIANPYFTPNDLAPVTAFTTELQGKLGSFEPIKTKVAEAGMGWEFLNMTVVYQDSGVEAGLKFRMKGEEATNTMLDKCRKLSSLVAQDFSGLRLRFKGVECLAYMPGEKLEEAPASGSQFLTWKDLKL